MVEFAAGVNEASFSIEITDDSVAEAEEKFVAVISAPNAEASSCAFLVSLRDDDGNEIMAIVMLIIMLITSIFIYLPIDVTFRLSATQLLTRVIPGTIVFRELLIQKIGSHERDLNITIQIPSSTADEGKNKRKFGLLM